MNEWTGDCFLIASYEDDAALVHTSAKNDVNCKLLYQYTVEWVTNQSFSRFDDEMDIVDSIFRYT